MSIVDVGRHTTRTYWALCMRLGLESRFPTVSQSFLVAATQQLSCAHNLHTILYWRGEARNRRGESPGSQQTLSRCLDLRLYCRTKLEQLSSASDAIKVQHFSGGIYANQMSWTSDFHMPCLLITSQHAGTFVNARKENYRRYF